MARKSRMFLFGNSFDVGGVNNVNRNIISVLKDRISYPKCHNKYLRAVEMLIQVFLNKTIIFSGITNVSGLAILFCCFLRKKSIYLMHGLLQLEDSQNDFKNSSGEKNERLLIKYSDRIYCVSERFSVLIKSYYPQYSSKIDYVTNGINWNDVQVVASQDRDPNQIVLIGGGRRTKQNLQVCKAVDEINEKYGKNLHINVYGSLFGVDSNSIRQCKCVTYSNVIPHEKFMEVLSHSSLFVQNSDFEPFSLGVVEAVFNGCNILVSKNVGALDYLTVNDHDVINDNKDIKEISDKILYVLTNSNNHRILASINRDKSSIEYAANKLYNKAISL